MLTRPKSALREHWRIFAPLGLGWIAGFFLFARGLNAVMSVSETVCVWLFVGLIAGSVPALYREAGREGRPASSWAWLALCAAGLFAGLYYVRHALFAQAAPDFRQYALCGVLLGAGAVLPGFSASPVMMALGLYQPLLDSLSRFDFAALAPCLTGAAVTAALLARGMARLFRLHYAAVSHGVLGVVIASALSMVPLRYGGAAEILLSGLCGAGGFLLALRMGRAAP
jgi:putative membrane protein